MDVLVIVFWGVLTFSILVVLHEGGHFAAARAFGVKVHEFMVGLPGPALKVKLGETSYGVTAIPLGGYVRIAGMEPGAEDPKLAEALWTLVQQRETDADHLAIALDTDDDTADALLFTLVDYFAAERIRGSEATGRDTYRPLVDPRPDDTADTLLARVRKSTYRGLPTWKRILVLAAGVTVNLLAAILVFTIVLSVFGTFEQSMTLEKIVPRSGAAVAGLKPGDKLTSIDGARTKDWQTFVTTLGKRKPGQTVRIGYVRDGRARSAAVKLGKDPQSDRPLLGVQVRFRHIKLNVFQALLQSFVWLGLVFKAISEFFNPSTFRAAAEGARSVVGISIEVRNAAREGVLMYAWIIAWLSLSLGALNILPIPPLDGGKIAMELLEKVIGRPVPRRISLGISIAGTLLLFTLIGYLMYADVMRYIIRG